MRHDLNLKTFEDILLQAWFAAWLIPTFISCIKKAKKLCWKQVSIRIIIFLNALSLFIWML